LFQQLETMSASRHGRLCLRKVADYRFAGAISQVPLMFNEMREASRHFPIVFPAASPQRPVAILGDSDGINRFVDESGRWTAGYLPAFIRKYPFALAPQEARDGQHAVLIDPKAPHFSVEEGEPLFDGQSVVTQGSVAEAIAFLKRFQKEANAVPGHFQALTDSGVLIERHLDLRKDGKVARRITGVCLVNRDRLTSLSDATLANWARSGLLEAVHAHWMSLSNFHRLIN